MLVLRRKINEVIQIQDNIEIEILAIEGDQVKLGITAPKNIDIYRKEVLVNIKKENEKASFVPDDLIKKLK